MTSFATKRHIGLLLAGSLLAACAETSTNDDGGDGPSVPATNGCASNQEECDAVRDKITKLEAERDVAQDRNDWVTVARLSLHINWQNELMRLIVDGQLSDAARTSLADKYTALHRMLEDDLVRGQGNRVRKVPGMVYHPLEVEAVAAVFKDFGDLYVSPSDQSVDDGWQELKVDMPWSGYWYPLRGTDLFQGEDAPLRKLDRALMASGRVSGAVDQERNYHELAHADSWEGLCAAWALAAANTLEPTSDVYLGGVTFTPMDQKALLIKIHERAPHSFYGIRYFGDADTDGTIQDLRPEAFHRLFTEMLGRRQKPFIVDDDPSVEVWSKPVYRVRWTIKQDPERDDAFLVKAFPWMVRHRDALKSEPTSLSDRASVVYEYRLFVDKTQKHGDGFKVLAGEWIGDARNAHPDAAMVATAGEPVSLNSVINDSMDLVKQIVKLP